MLISNRIGYRNTILPMALVVMLAMALGRVREKRAGLMRSLVRAA